MVKITEKPDILIDLVEKYMILAICHFHLYERSQDHIRN